MSARLPPPASNGDSVRGTIPARVKSRGSPESFDFTARFIVASPKEPNEIAEHDRGWLELIERKTAQPIVRNA